MPAAGRVVMTTLRKPLSGSSNGSVKPKSAAAKVWLASSSMVAEPLVPAGASLTEVTLRVVTANGELLSAPSLTVHSIERLVLSGAWSVLL